jgi:hypothetical protein
VVVVSAARNVGRVPVSVLGHRGDVYIRAQTENMFISLGPMQGCQILLDATYVPKRKWKYQMTKGPSPNGRKIFQMATKYTDIFHFNVLQNIPKLEFLAIK